MSLVLFLLVSQQGFWPVEFISQNIFLYLYVCLSVYLSAGGWFMAVAVGVAVALAVAVGLLVLVLLSADVKKLSGLPYKWFFSCIDCLKQ